MQISLDGLSLVKTSEGFRAYTYNDVAGFPTIGYGHKLLPGESYPNGITEAQATTLLLADLQSAEASVARLVKVALTQGQYDALVDFTYNLGAGRLASSTLLRLLNAGNYTAVPAQLLEWDKAGGVTQPGLLTRRKAEAALWVAA